ncbi:MAG: hypothetical protein H6744_04890, partial [Deltaproteobacteria bacterium]|nr:hypothetical protein [Deltaproteobacteria bacterium]
MLKIAANVFKDTNTAISLDRCAGTTVENNRIEQPIQGAAVEGTDLGTRPAWTSTTLSGTNEPVEISGNLFFVGPSSAPTSGCTQGISLVGAGGAVVVADNTISSDEASVSVISSNVCLNPSCPASLDLAIYRNSLSSASGAAVEVLNLDWALGQATEPLFARFGLPDRTSYQSLVGATAGASVGGAELASWQGHHFIEARGGHPYSALTPDGVVEDPTPGAIYIHGVAHFGVGDLRFNDGYTPTTDPTFDATILVAHDGECVDGTDVGEAILHGVTCRASGDGIVLSEVRSLVDLWRVYVEGISGPIDRGIVLSAVEDEDAPIPQTHIAWSAVGSFLRSGIAHFGR